jgi:hypothetical protein
MTGPRRYEGRRAVRSGSHSIKHRLVITDGPMLDDQSICKAKDVDLRPSDLIALHWQTSQPRERVADMSAAGGVPDRYPVFIVRNPVQLGASISDAPRRTLHDNFEDD